MKGWRKMGECVYVGGVGLETENREKGRKAAASPYEEMKY